jgi:putative toxin-antitoxin system antitoxin component (TIGR02293 family)
MIPRQYRVIFKSAPSERIAFVKQGVPTSRIDDLAKSMGISLSKILDLVGLPKASFHRWSSGGKNLPVSESERVIGLMKLVGQVENMVAESGDPTGFDASKWVASWIEEPLPALGGRAPKEFLDTAEGQNLVSNLLSRIQSGTFS